MNWFKNGPTEATQGTDESPSMHILALNPHTKLPFGLTAEGTSTVMLPAITTDGRLSFLLAGDEDDFYRIQQDVYDRIQKLPKECVAYICVAVVLRDPDDKELIYLIYEVKGFTEPMLELGHLYYSLANLRVSGDEYWTGVEKFFSSDPARSWINSLIESIKQELNWTEYVDQALARLR